MISWALGPGLHARRTGTQGNRAVSFTIYVMRYLFCMNYKLRQNYPDKVIYIYIYYIYVYIYIYIYIYICVCVYNMRIICV